MLNVNTTLTHGEHKVSVYEISLIAATSESTPMFVMVLVDRNGETITVSTPICNGFDIYHVQQIMNSLIDGLNESFPVELSETFNGDDLFPRLDFINFSNFRMSLKTLEYLMKDFETDITINLTGEKFEPIQIKAVEHA